MNAAELLYRDLDAHLQADARPSEFIERSATEKAFQSYPFLLLGRLKDTPQSPIHHPEGSAWVHTLLVVDEAAGLKQQSKNPRVFLWTALLHDIGKPPTTKIRRGRITSYDHDKAGAKLAAEFLRFFREEELFIREVCALVRYHMHLLYVLKDLPFGDPAGMLRETDPKEVALLGLCDRLGRYGADKAHEEAQIEEFLQKCISMKGSNYGKSRHAQAEPQRTARHGKQP